MSDDKPDQLTFTAQRDADPAAFRESQLRGAAATREYWRQPRPPAWLDEMTAAEFIAYLERQEAKRGNRID